VNAGLYFIFPSILFSVSFHFLSLFYLGLGWSVMSHVIWYCHRMVTSMSQSQSQDHVMHTRSEKVLEQMSLYNTIKACWSYG